MRNQNQTYSICTIKLGDKHSHAEYVGLQIIKDEYDKKEERKNNKNSIKEAKIHNNTLSYITYLSVFSK